MGLVGESGFPSAFLPVFRRDALDVRFYVVEEQPVRVCKDRQERESRQGGDLFFARHFTHLSCLTKICARARNAVSAAARGIGWGN